MTQQLKSTLLCITHRESRDIDSQNDTTQISVMMTSIELDQELQHSGSTASRQTKGGLYDGVLLFPFLRPRTKQNVKNKRSPLGSSKDCGAPQEILCTKYTGGC